MITPKNLKIAECLSSNILRTTMMITKLLIHLSYLQFNGNMNYNEIWIYDPTFIRNTRFEESPTRNSYSHMGLTRNPINRVPSARFTHLWRKLRIHVILVRNMQLQADLNTHNHTP